MAEKISRSSTIEDKKFSIINQLIMDEVLPRFGVKHLTRLKLVCKKWNSTISSINFAKLHLKFSSSNNNHHNRHFFVNYCLISYIDCINVKNLRMCVKPYFLYSRFVGFGYDIVDCCNGIVGFHQYNYSMTHCFFTLWNPATGEDWHIPSPQGVHLSKANGFGYVGSLDDYVVVASFRSGSVDASVFRGFYVFSLKAMKWERVFGCFDYLQTPRLCWKWKRVCGRTEEVRIAEGIEGQAIMVGDVMYWACKNIVGFDVLTKELREYPSLDWQCEYQSLELFRVKGCLSFLGSRVNNVSDFWMLKNPSDWSSWQKTLSVDLTNVSLLTFSETGKCLVPQEDEFKLVDPCKEALECTKGNGATYGRKMIVKDHVESLISLFQITKADEEEDKNGL